MSPAASIANELPVRLPPPPLPDPARTALFVDVDGTLLDFAPTPGGVVVEPGLPELLQRLALHFSGALAPISGRPLREVDALLAWHGAAAGLHGAEWRHLDGEVGGIACPDATLERLREYACERAAALAGVLVEQKPNAIALHFRSAPDRAEAAAELARALAREAGPDYTLQHGNHVVELKPAGVDKGAALARMMQRAPFAGRLPWVVGDDLTDEHAFAAALARGGTGILVGTRRPTVAHWSLAEPRDVRAWLDALAARPDTPA